MRPFGGQTLTFVTVTENLNDRDRYNNPAEIRTETAVPGCRFRPLPASEIRTDGTEVVGDQWKATCPPAVVGAKPRDQVTVNGAAYQIVGGPRTFADRTGAPFKVTLVCERLAG